MKRGAKPKSPRELKAAGTFRHDRHGQLVEIEATRDLPQQPEWLTESGRQIWLDLIGPVSAMKTAAEVDAVMFGTLCNLIGAAALCWQSGAVPPAAHLMELRRLAEMFRMAGAVSRVGMPAPTREENPFVLIGRGRGPDGHGR